MKERRGYDLTGRTFGQWTVIEEAGRSKKWDRLWRCRCSCGEEQVIPTYALRSGATTKCQKCRRKNAAIAASKANARHGKSDSRIYRIWRGMKRRCENPNQKNYPNYGGRGIVICSEWSESFESFYEWAIQNGYDDDLSIDRIDNDGNYCPQNCRWTTRKEQASNTSKNRMIIAGGEELTLQGAADKFGIKRETLAYRLNHGMSVEDAINKGFAHDRT